MERLVAALSADSDPDELLWHADVNRGELEGVACPACQHTTLVWWCIECSPLDTPGLAAGCPACGHVFSAPREPEPCPPDGRHSCCNSWLAGRESWLPISCARRWCGARICVCLQPRAAGCGGTL